MWKIKHHGSCMAKDGNRVFVVRRITSVEDSHGNTLDADTKGGEVLRAECDSCGAKAEWVD